MISGPKSLDYEMRDISGVVVGRIFFSLLLSPRIGVTISFSELTMVIPRLISSETGLTPMGPRVFITALSTRTVWHTTARTQPAATLKRPPTQLSAGIVTVGAADM